MLRSKNKITFITDTRLCFTDLLSLLTNFLFLTDCRIRVSWIDQARELPVYQAIRSIRPAGLIRQGASPYIRPAGICVQLGLSKGPNSWYLQLGTRLVLVSGQAVDAGKSNMYPSTTPARITWHHRFGSPRAPCGESADVGDTAL